MLMPVSRQNNQCGVFTSDGVLGAFVTTQGQLIHQWTTNDKGSANAAGKPPPLRISAQYNCETRTAAHSKRQSRPNKPRRTKQSLSLPLSLSPSRPLLPGLLPVLRGAGAGAGARRRLPSPTEGRVHEVGHPADDDDAAGHEPVGRPRRSVHRASHRRQLATHLRQAWRRGRRGQRTSGAGMSGEVRGGDVRGGQGRGRQGR